MLTESRPVKGWKTVVVSRYDVVIHVSEPFALTPVPISETAVVTMVCSKRNSIRSSRILL